MIAPMSAGRLLFRCAIDFDRAIDSNDEFLVPFARVVPLLRDRGIEFHPSRGDFQFVDSNVGPSSSEHPMVLFDRADGAALWWRYEPRKHVARGILESPRTLGLVKISKYRSCRFYNELGDEGCHHIALCGDPDRDRRNGASQLPDISESAFSRIRLGAGYWAFDQCVPLAEKGDGIVLGRRDFDVFCALSVSYASPEISRHRELALDRLADLRGVRSVLGRGRIFSREQFHELLGRARICVSPWGWGETCIRDYEALLAGCVLIKPRTDFIDSAFPLTERHYVACEPDFSDLSERVRQVLDNWSTYADQTWALRHEVLRARDPNMIADVYAAALRASMPL
jgi:hypothetical protein